MSKKFFFRSLRVRNFRVFNDLHIENFKRINVIGGFNGAGKSALLETLFLLVDLKNPICLVRPYSWRKTGIMGQEGLKMLFQSDSQPGEIDFGFRDGDKSVRIELCALPQSALSAISASVIPRTTAGGSSVLSKEGIRVSMRGKSEEYESFLIPHNEGYVGTITKFSDLQTPFCQMLSPNLRVLSPEMAEWLSDCIKGGKKDAVIEHLKILDPSIQDLLILQNTAGPIIYAKRPSGLIPIELLGDGFNSLLTTLLSIFRFKNSIVLLDEVDTSIHYSVTAKFWEIVASAANEADCQIFAASHSREAILNAAAGIAKSGFKLDFQYMRIERSNDSHRAIVYSYDDIMNASEHGFEFR
ncbi:MAG: AAA family ATPase [Pseudomonadota bacterium]